MELILASIADDLGRSGSFCCVWHGESVLAIPTDLIPKVFGSFQQYRPETGRLESSSDGARGLGTPQAEHEPAAGPGNTTGQQHLGLC